MIAERAEDESSSEEEQVDRLTKEIPAYPFPAEFHLECHGSRIEAIRHLCKRHPQGTRVVAVFFPGVHGGVGPCRQPGEAFDSDALYPTVARRLVGECDADVDCYRCSWPFMRPSMNYAVGGACRIIHHALTEALQGEAAERELRVVIVGHSLGGAVAAHAAEVVARFFGVDGLGGRRIEGFERAVVRVWGVCTINGALDVSQLQDDPFASLGESHALLVSGDADQVVAPRATAELFEVMPMREKRHLVMPGGTHDLFGHKAQLVQELEGFILQALGGERCT